MFQRGVHYYAGYAYCSLVTDVMSALTTAMTRVIVNFFAGSFLSLIFIGLCRSDTLLWFRRPTSSTIASLQHARTVINSQFIYTNI